MSSYRNKKVGGSLPEEFTSKMADLLGDEYEEFIAAFDMPTYQGLRVNTLKVSVDRFRAITPFALEHIPWARTGFYTLGEVKPAKHPYYHAGLYYIQEPSAMAPAAIAGAKPGERVLDLCAAPGGKSTQLAADLQGQGILVSNDIDEDRVKALTKNLELAGVRNAVVTCEPPEKLANVFRCWFDKIVIDAPCSGEGMFRKDPQAIRSWGSFSCQRCGGMQREILRHAATMLRAGGRIVYSTCTFAPEEDEQTMDWFLEEFPSFELLSIEMAEGFQPGRPQWASGRPELSKTVRLWPHRLRGEGHYVALLGLREGAEAPTSLHDNLITPGSGPDERSRKGPRPGKKGAQTKPRYETERLSTVPEPFQEFVTNVINTEVQELVTGRAEGLMLLQRGDNLYVSPAEMPDLSALNVVRPGWFVGLMRKGRFEPSNALATALRPQDARLTLNLPSDSSDVIRYLKCETLSTVELEGKGWTLVSTDGFTLGWGKLDGNTLKNNYPAWWRWSG